MAKQDMVAIIRSSGVKAVNDKKFSAKDFRTIYKPSKKDNGMGIQESSWRQTINLNMKDFPELTERKINAEIVIVCSGLIIGMEEKSIRIGINQVALADAKEDGE